MTALPSTNTVHLRDLLVQRLPDLNAFARRLTRDAAAADDLVQETVVTALAKAHVFEGARPIGPWLNGILWRHFKHTYRQDARRVRLPPPFVSTEPSAADAVLAAEAAVVVRRGLARLPWRYREVLELFFLTGLSHAEIAERLARSRSTVSTQLNRGLALLRAASRERAESRPMSSRRQPDRSLHKAVIADGAHAPRQLRSIS